MNKIKVQMVQLNTSYGNQHYFPYSVGVLASYASLDEDIASQIELQPFLFKRGRVETLCDEIGEVDILAISCYMWNWELSIAISKEIKERYPDTTIVLGGPHIPNENEDFFDEYPYIDLTCHGEGELVFRNFLSEYLSGRKEFYRVQGLSWNDYRNDKVYNYKEKNNVLDFNDIPSAYLSGIFDELIGMYPETNWMAVWETNRGCPYKCTFCDWGSEENGKIRKFSSDRIENEIKWFSKNKIEIVFGADANFGMLKRDYELAELLSEEKNKTGYPKAFRVCFAKNSTKRIFDIAKVFYESDMYKGVSISMQSLNEDVLNNIKRENIKLSNFQELQSMYNEANMSTFSEIIVGLPGENYQTFIEGLNALLTQGQHSGINIYNCAIMPNAEMGSKEYIKKYGLKTVKQPIFQAHSSRPGADDPVIEYENIIVETDTMSKEDWKKMYHFSWVVQCFHLLGLLQNISIFCYHQYDIDYKVFYQELLDFGYENKNTLINQELEKLDEILEQVLVGKGFDQYLEEYLDVNWPVEEASFLRITEKLDKFYDECSIFLKSVLNKSQKSINIMDVEELLLYQKSLISHYKQDERDVLELNYNFEEYIKSCKVGKPIAFEKAKTHYEIENHSFGKDKEQYAREIVWYGRKGGRFLNKIENSCLLVNT